MVRAGECNTTCCHDHGSTTSTKYLVIEDSNSGAMNHDAKSAPRMRRKQPLRAERPTAIAKETPQHDTLPHSPLIFASLKDLELRSASPIRRGAIIRALKRFSIHTTAPGESLKRMLVLVCTCRYKRPVKDEVPISPGRPTLILTFPTMYKCRSLQILNAGAACVMRSQRDMMFAFVLTDSPFLFRDAEAQAVCKSNASQRHQQATNLETKSAGKASVCEPPPISPHHVFTDCRRLMDDHSSTNTNIALFLFSTIDNLVAANQPDLSYNQFTSSKFLPIVISRFSICGVGIQASEVGAPEDCGVTLPIPGLVVLAIYSDELVHCSNMQKLGNAENVEGRSGGYVTAAEPSVAVRGVTQRNMLFPGFTFGEEGRGSVNEDARCENDTSSDKPPTHVATQLTSKVGRDYETGLDLPYSPNIHSLVLQLRYEWQTRQRVMRLRTWTLSDPSRRQVSREQLAGCGQRGKENIGCMADWEVLCSSAPLPSFLSTPSQRLNYTNTFNTYMSTPPTSPAKPNNILELAGQDPTHDLKHALQASMNYGRVVSTSEVLINEIKGPRELQFLVRGRRDGRREPDSDVVPKVPSTRIGFVPMYIYLPAYLPAFALRAEASMPTYTHPHSFLVCRDPQCRIVTHYHICPRAPNSINSARLSPTQVQPSTWQHIQLSTNNILQTFHQTFS
ncbi:uncharacterized protein BDR25DRAFT_352467 [Lindgomyces ingoldianus]|uniref:Uncharacterized protein n=1 Tax=Lindgomyces ingoldianus TaxID=673940 RepID=A0ACB6R3W3_9PLEO|nr:uncharacterized protein BDR25DRAFT_352467 [Lindgomyces ingoldianus]KAF2474004.1 hypothetical protein BDR25DRAFT_352467 [Lindgomyces ingoldianus]